MEQLLGGIPLAPINPPHRDIKKCVKFFGASALSAIKSDSCSDSVLYYTLMFSWSHSEACADSVGKPKQIAVNIQAIVDRVLFNAVPSHL